MYQNAMQADAAAVIHGEGEGAKLWGEVQFYQRQGYVLVTVQVSGLPRENPSGFFALHIHEGTDCGGEIFSNTGSHYNPGETPHPDHAGDLPPLMLCNGGAFMSVGTDRFRVMDIIGRTVVIHSGSDDFRSQPAGNAGTKIACGVIQSLR